MATDLKNNIIDKFDIKPGTAKSAAIQDFGEGTKTLDQIKQEFPDSWQDIVDADKWFRKFLDNSRAEHNAEMIKLYGDIDKARKAGVYIEKIDNYYRHMAEKATLFEKIKKVAGTQTTTGLEKANLNTSPFGKSKKVVKSIMKKRTGDVYTSDAVGGAVDYLQQAAYAKNMNRRVKEMREWIDTWSTKYARPKEAEGFYNYMNDFIDTLTGKRVNKGAFDRAAETSVGKAVDWLYSRAKANAVLGRASTLVSQTLNLPNGIALVDNPIMVLKGLGKQISGGHADAYKQSGFLTQRFGDELLRNIKATTLDKPKNVALLLMETADEAPTKWIWSSAYEKAIANNIENPIKYADELTRKAVAGRGIGEIPLIQKSKAYQVLAPFSVEVANAWRVTKDSYAKIGKGVTEKDAKKFFEGVRNVSTLLVAKHIMGEGKEQLTGTKSIDDVLGTILDYANSEDEKGIEDLVASLLGEYVGMIPTGPTAASLYPEYGTNVLGFDLPSRKDLFGDSDISRYGTQGFFKKMWSDPVTSFVTPWGGEQIRQSIKTGRSEGVLPKESIPELLLGKEPTYTETPGLYVKDFSKMQRPIDMSITDKLKAYSFGMTSLPEVREHYEEDRRPFTERQTNALNSISSDVNNNLTITELYDIMTDLRKKDIDTKAGVIDELTRLGIKQKTRNEILTEYFDWKPE